MATISKEKTVVTLMFSQSGGKSRNGSLMS
jgi:hypothetical protein